MVCFTWMVLILGFIFVMITLLRWFEQITQAVDQGLWNRVFALIAAPFLVWMHPGQVAAGRPTPFPTHEPVRGFGTVPQVMTDRPAPSAVSDAAVDVIPSRPSTDQPPPGTPAEFIGLPKIPPPKPKGSKRALDPDKIAKLRQKMREQGMLPPEE